MNKKIKIFGLPGTSELTKTICEKIKIEPSIMHVYKFADDEILCKPDISVRNQKIIIIQSLCKPVNDNLMTLLIAIDSLKRASAQEINVIITYYGYARQDRKASGREPITAKLIANMIETAGASRVMILDVHSQQIQGFFNIPVDTLRGIWSTLNVLVEDEDLSNLVVVAPDYGGVKRARIISEVLNVPLAIIDKRRPRPNVVEVENVLGDVDNKNCLLVDDMIDTGGTLLAAANLLKKNNANKVIALATHGLFNKNAVEDFNKAYDDKILEKIYVTNTINNVYNLPIKGLKIIDIADFFAGVIKIYIQDEGSISTLYMEYQDKIAKKVDKKRKK